MIRSIALAVLLAVQEPSLPAEPDAKALAEAQKLIRDLYKQDYAKKTPADRQQLSRKLLEKGLETKDDAAARFVMLDEARDLAVQAADLSGAVAAVDAIGKSFLVDAVAMKLGALAKLAGQAKTPEALRDLAAAYLDAVPEAVRRDDYDAAESAATKAETVAKASRDNALAGRAAAAKREAVSIKADYGKVKAWMQNPAAGDGEAVGAFLCFMKGDWAHGLPLLAASDKSPYQALAKKDLAAPAEAAGQVEVGDGWFEAAQKEKQPARKLRVLGRMREWYEKAAGESSGIARVKIEKRLSEAEELEDAQQGTLRLLRMIDLKTDAVAGAFTLQAGILVTPADVPFARIQIPFAMPEEYDLSLLAVRKSGANSFAVGLPAGASQCMLTLDGGAGGDMSGLDMIDGKGFNVNETTFAGKNLLPDVPVFIKCAVRKTDITVWIGGKKVVQWKGDFKKLSLFTPWAMPRKDVAFIGTWQSGVQVSHVVLTPVTGQGRKIR